MTAPDRSHKQKINKEIPALNDTLAQTVITDIYGVFHLRTSDYTFFSRAHKTVSRADHMSGHKTSLNKFKKIEIIPSIFFNHSALKIEINCKKEARNPTNMWKIN